MDAIKGTYTNGRVVLDEPADWPEGTEVVVNPLVPGSGVVPSADLQGDDPESIARWLAEFDAIPPLQMTPEEEADWQAARRARKDSELAAWEERVRRIEGPSS